MGSWNNKEKITHENVLLVEGIDAYYFCIWALDAYNIDNTQVIDFGGNGQLDRFLTLFKSFIPGSEKVKNLLILRDAELNADSAVSSIKSALSRNGFKVPVSPFEFIQGSPNIAYGLFPGVGAQNGTLEDLCLYTVTDDSTYKYVEQLICKMESDGHKFSHPHKTKLHSYLAIKNNLVGLKLGEAARARAFDWNHPSMQWLNKLLSSTL